MPRQLKMALLWTGAFTVHAIAQFIVWAGADSRFATRASGVLTSVLTFPTFTLAGQLAVTAGRSKHRSIARRRCGTAPLRALPPADRSGRSEGPCPGASAGSASRDGSGCPADDRTRPRRRARGGEVHSSGH